MFRFGIQNITHSVVRPKHQGLVDKSLLEFLDLLDFINLKLHRAIVMDDANSSIELKVERMP